jgi:DNA-binding transcriptional MerR regulator
MTVPETRPRPRTATRQATPPPPPHQSIGEVLATLREEFTDITISKIRFLESQGLIDPERTPSGYRKFYTGDVERLRWILRQQKDHFLPLKVIRVRLEELEAQGFADVVAAPSAPTAPTAEPEPPRSQDAVSVSNDDPPSGGGRRGAKPRGGGGRARDRSAPELPVDDPDDDAPELRLSTTGASLTRAELARAAGLDDAQLGELESYGLLNPTVQTKDRVLFDEDALAIARLAAGFFRHGVEARHLRMYRTAAEREAVLFEQVLLGYLRQRNPEARSLAQEKLEELARLGRGLRGAYLRRAVRDAFSE